MRYVMMMRSPSFFFLFLVITIQGVRASARCSAFTIFPPVATAITVRHQHRHQHRHLHRHQHRLHFFSNVHINSRALSSTSATNAPITKDGEDEEVHGMNDPLPVGIFVDLDNIRLSTYSRADAQRFFRPLQAFSQRIGGEIVRFQAFGNLSTRTWRPPKERSRLKGGIVDSQEWNPESHHTGYDKDGILRCGICGTRIKLNKNDRAKGRDMEDKLNNHMKMLHDREQTKRQNMQRKHRRKDNVRKQSHKYKMAQIDTGRQMGKRNQLFAILREVGIRCFPVDDADAALMKSARQWMGPLKSRRRTPLTPQQEELLSLSLPSPSPSPSKERGCLIVVSNDSDFRQLLEHGRRRGYLVVSATLEETQTRALMKASDLVLRAAAGASVLDPMTRRGSEFMLLCEERWKKDPASSHLDGWDLSGMNDDVEDESSSPARKPKNANKQDRNKDSTTQAEAPRKQKIGLTECFSEKILEQHPYLDVTNQDIAKRVASFTKLLRSTRKKDRSELVRIELHIRLYHWDMHRSVPKPSTASIGRLALALHWAQGGKKFSPDSFRSPAKQYTKMSPNEQKRELKKRNLSVTGTKKQLQNRLLVAIDRDYTSKMMEYYFEANEERNLALDGCTQEIIERLVKSVLGLEESDRW